MNVLIQRLPHALGLDHPFYGTELSAGLDISAAIDGSIILAPGQRTLVPTGFAYALPEGFEGQIRPRSGLALKHGITVLNTPGTVDADYRGEVKVILINLGQEPFVIERGMRIAQLIIAPVRQVVLEEVSELPDSARDSFGFGSTGVNQRRA
ncbi:MAG: dUTP diphosphatase [Alphaproteobacteria bacterium]|nr:dUTP diphosphatase [Alphaproteobacteria bacterium]